MLEVDEIKARLEVDASMLHRQIGLLSNTLGGFSDSQITERKTVVDAIKTRRAEWRQLNDEIDYIEKHGRLPELAGGALSDVEQEKRTNALLKINAGIRQCQSAIWKIDQKKKQNPTHKNMYRWEDQAAMYQMELRKWQLDKERYA